MMTRRSYRALVVIGAVAAVILTALLAVTPRPPLVEVIEGPPVTVSVGPPPAGPTPTELSELPADPLPEVEPIPIPDWLPLLIRLVVIAVVVGLLIHLARRVIQARRATRRRTAEAPGGDAVEVAEIDRLKSRTGQFGIGPGRFADVIDNAIEAQDVLANDVDQLLA